MKEETSKKIDRIAKSIAAEFNNRIAYSFSVNTINGVEQVTVRAVKIIVNTTKTNKVNDSVLIAGKKKRKNNQKEKPPAVKHDESGPVYPLSTVISILTNTPVNVKIEDRPDSIINTLNVTEQQAIEILKKLQPSEYQHTDRERDKIPADVYSKWTTINEFEVELYIKFKVSNNVYLVVISIHEPEDKPSKNYRGRKPKK